VHGEIFRPFTPSILGEYESEYFDLEISRLCMFLVSKVKKPEIISAVIHVVSYNKHIICFVIYDFLNWGRSSSPILSCILSISRILRIAKYLEIKLCSFYLIVETFLKYAIVGFPVCPSIEDCLRTFSVESSNSNSDNFLDCLTCTFIL